MHELSALMWKDGDGWPEGLIGAESGCCRLPQDLVLLPLTPELRSTLGEAQGTEPIEGFVQLEPAVAKLAADISQGRAIAYVETDYFGGEGTQASVLWQVGGAPVVRTSGSGDDAINAVLEDLGVVCEEGLDAFDTVGLGLWRSTGEWAAVARTQPAAERLLAASAYLPDAKIVRERVGRARYSLSRNDSDVASHLRILASAGRKAGLSPAFWAELVEAATLLEEPEQTRFLVRMRRRAATRGR